MDMLIIKKFYWSWIHLIEQTCPSKEKANIKLSNIISWLLPIFEEWWRRGGTNTLSHVAPLTRTISNCNHLIKSRSVHEGQTSYLREKCD